MAGVSLRGRTEGGGEGGSDEGDSLVFPEQLYVVPPKNGHLIVYLTTYFFRYYTMLMRSRI